eukprot:10421105-Prorocentrum_lima.AAC.1
MRQLRRLLVKFWHPPAQRLAELLRHVGAPSSAIAKIKPVVDSCSVCRLWTIPGPRSMTTLRLATECVQMGRALPASRH